MKYYKTPTKIGIGFITHNDCTRLKFEVVKDVVQVDGTDADAAAWASRNNLADSDFVSFNAAKDANLKSSFEYRLAQVESEIAKLKKQ